MSINNTILITGINSQIIKNEISTYAGFKEIIFQYSVEFLGSSLLTGVACLFAATPQVATSLLIFNIFLQSLNAVAKTPDIFWLKNQSIIHTQKDQQSERPHPKTKNSQLFSAFFTSLTYGATGNVLIHEAGHAGAASLLYQQASPSVSINGLFEGSTTWIKNDYTSLGQFLGPKNVQIFISMAGPMAAVSIATIGVILAVHFYNKQPIASQHLFLCSIISIVLHINYTLLALSSSLNDLGNDFVMLSTLGLHPLIFTISMIAIPTLAIWLSTKK